MNRPIVIHVFDGDYEKVFVNDELIVHSDCTDTGVLLIELGRRLGFDVVSEDVDSVDEYDK